MSDDTLRQVPTSSDTAFTVTIEDALRSYEEAGLPRTPRSVQRYCAKGHLECRLIETSFGEKYLITPGSLEKHIAYVKEITPAASRDMSRFAASSVTVEKAAETSATKAAIDDAPSRPVATSRDTKYVAQLERENEFLRGQLVVKDQQIKDLTERARETNVLIGGLQRLFSPLLNAKSESSTE